MDIANIKEYAKNCRVDINAGIFEDEPESIWMIEFLLAELDNKDKKIKDMLEAGKKLIEVLQKDPTYRKAIFEEKLQNFVDEGIKKFIEMYQSKP